MTNHLKTIMAPVLVTLLCSTCFGLQSGSRSSAPSGISGGQSFSSPQFNAPTANFNQPISQFQSQQFPNGDQFFGEPQVLDNRQFEQFQSATSPQVGNSAGNQATGGDSSSLGIPASSLVDPIFQIHDLNSVYTVDHSAWNCFLSRYVTTDSAGINRVCYGQVSQCDRQILQDYLQRLQATDVRTLNRNEQLAYWFNLYNAKMISIVLDNYPIRSVRQIKQKLTDFVGPFDDEGVLHVLGKPLSLNDIESGIIRPVWNDPRIHYALNCASLGCPNLSPTAWTASNLDGQLNSAAYTFINSGRAVKLTPFGIRTSKIYKWYEADFGGTDQAVLAHIRQYADRQTANTICNYSSISGHFYDWSLNDGRIQRRRIFESIIR